jgi:hypothetical protein
MPEEKDDEIVNKNLWVVIIIVAGFMGFLFGYAGSAFTMADSNGGHESRESSGY